MWRHLILCHESILLILNEDNGVILPTFELMHVHYRNGGRLSL